MARYRLKSDPQVECSADYEINTVFIGEYSGFPPFRVPCDLFELHWEPVEHTTRITAKALGDFVGASMLGAYVIEKKNRQISVLQREIKGWRKEIEEMRSAHVETIKERDQLRKENDSFKPLDGTFRGFPLYVKAGHIGDADLQVLKDRWCRHVKNAHEWSFGFPEARASRSTVDDCIDEIKELQRKLDAVTEERDRLRKELEEAKRAAGRKAGE